MHEQGGAGWSAQSWKFMAHARGSLQILHLSNLNLGLWDGCLGALNHNLKTTHEEQSACKLASVVQCPRCDA